MFDKVLVILSVRAIILIFGMQADNIKNIVLDVVHPFTVIYTLPSQHTQKPFVKFLLIASQQLIQPNWMRVNPKSNVNYSLFQVTAYMHCIPLY